MRIKGRLKNINPIGFDLNRSVMLTPEDYYSLIEQVKRVQELEQQNERYREALEAIAYFDDKEEGEAATRIDVKYIARKALEGEDYDE